MNNFAQKFAKQNRLPTPVKWNLQKAAKNPLQQDRLNRVISREDGQMCVYNYTHICKGAFLTVCKQLTEHMRHNYLFLITCLTHKCKGTSMPHSHYGLLHDREEAGIGNDDPETGIGIKRRLVFCRSPGWFGCLSVDTGWYAYQASAHTGFSASVFVSGSSNPSKDHCTSACYGTT